MKIKLTLFSILISFAAVSQIRLPSLASSHMVLQQNDSVTLWGWSGPDEKVVITTGWNNKKDSTKSNNGWRF